MHKKRDLSLNDLIGLTQDLDDGFEHRAQSDGMPAFVFDANIVWMLQDEKSNANSFGGGTGKTLGWRRALSLIRWSLQRLSEKEGRLRMLEAHKYEVDIAFAEQHDWDYEDVVGALKAAIEEAKLNNPNVSENAMVKAVVKLLKANYSKSYLVLTDVLSQDTITKRTEYLSFGVAKPKPVNEIPRSLKSALGCIGDILRYGDDRPSFTVSQDMKALRDLALLNIAPEKRKTVLITLDKKLLDAVRMYRMLDDQWSQYLLVESLDTFWVWLVGSEQVGLESDGASHIQNVLDDYRFRAKNIFFCDDGPGRQQQQAWIANPHWLETFSKNEELKQFEPLQKRIREVIERQNDKAHPDIEQLRVTCKKFFKEVGEMLPASQIACLREMDRSKYLEDALEHFGLSADEFFQSLDDDVQKHASESLKILGAATMLAPRILRAIDTYMSATGPENTRRSFIHRLPVPIQSDEFDLNVVLELVKTKGVRRTLKFERLLRLKKWKGPIADLVIAFLLVHAGDWAEAERICRTARSRPLDEIDRPVAYEMALLEAAILRIYKTNDDKLNNAERLLDQARRAEFVRPHADLHDFRISVEKAAIQINRHLLRIYRTSKSSKEGVCRDNWCEKYDKLLSELASIKSSVLSEMDDAEPLREKLLANINANMALLVEFVSDFDPVRKLGDQSIIKQALAETLTRLASRETTRISFFEEIVVTFWVLSNMSLLKIDIATELDLRSSLKAKLGRVLQRRDEINEFEYWIFRSVNSRIQQVDFYN